MEYKNYYQTLGLDRHASEEDIKKAYHRLVREYHPDLHPGDTEAEEKLKAINEAYEVLSDPDKRRKYDSLGAHWQRFKQAGGRPEDFDWSQWIAHPSDAHSYTGPFSLKEIERMFGSPPGGYSDFFQKFFGHVKRRQAEIYGDWEPLTQLHQDHQPETTVTITLEEAFHGTATTLESKDGRDIQVRIPPGVTSGSHIRINGQGDLQMNSNLKEGRYLNVAVAPHAIFLRDSEDLSVTIPIDLFTALLGGKVDVQAIDRPVKLTIPPETANGTVFRLRGLGMPCSGDPEKRGDLFVKVETALPRHLTSAEIRLVQQWQDARQRQKAPAGG